MIYRVTKKELKGMSDKNLKYYIYIRYGRDDDPTQYVALENGTLVDCTSGTSYGMRPYFIDNFLEEVKP